MKSSFFGGERPSYHHGRLKDALIEAARALVGERGPAGFTLAEAAKRVGVTGAAPYRHFADRQALMNALAAQGFAQFAAAQRAAWEGGRPEPAAAFRRMGRAYLTFAQSEPGLYGAMFGGSDAAANAKIAAESFELLVAATFVLLRQHGAPGSEAIALARQIWALCHGVATLANAGHLSAAGGADPAGLLESGSASLVEMAIRRAQGPAKNPSPARERGRGEGSRG